MASDPIIVISTGRFRVIQKPDSLVRFVVEEQRPIHTDLAGAVTHAWTTQMEPRGQADALEWLASEYAKKARK